MPVETLEGWASRMQRELPQVDAAVTRGLARLADRAVADARSRAPVGRGRLRESITARFVGHSDAGTLSVSASAPGAEVQEQGGTLVGRPWLAVPLRGVVSAGPRSDGPLFTLRTRDGRVFLASRRGGALDVRWRLLRSVHLRPHPYLRPAAERAAAEVPQVVADALRQTLEVR